MKDNVFTFKVLIEHDEEDGFWVATCLELGLVAVSKTILLVCSDISDIISVQTDYCFNVDNLDYLYRPCSLNTWMRFFNGSIRFYWSIQGKDLSCNDVLINFKLVLDVCVSN